MKHSAKVCCSAPTALRQAFAVLTASTNASNLSCGPADLKHIFKHSSEVPPALLTSVVRSIHSSCTKKVIAVHLLQPLLLWLILKDHACHSQLKSCPPLSLSLSARPVLARSTNNYIMSSMSVSTSLISCVYVGSCPLAILSCYYIIYAALNMLFFACSDHWLIPGTRMHG